VGHVEVQCLRLYLRLESDVFLLEQLLLFNGLELLILQLFDLSLEFMLWLLLEELPIAKLEIL